MNVLMMKVEDEDPLLIATEANNSAPKNLKKNCSDGVEIFKRSKFLEVS